MIKIFSIDKYYITVYYIRIYKGENMYLFEEKGKKLIYMVCKKENLLVILRKKR